MARRFSEWEKDLAAQQKRHVLMSLSDVEEFLSFGGHQITVTVGKTNYGANVDGVDGSPSRMLRSLYTEHKDEFESLLESITEHTDLVVEASRVMFDVVTADQIPGAVLERMKGEQVEDDPVQMIEKTCEVRFKELLIILEKAWLPSEIGVFSELAFATLVEGRELKISIEKDHQQVQWGEISAQRYKQYSQDLGNAETAMYFCLNYEAIRIRLMELLRQIGRVE